MKHFSSVGIIALLALVGCENTSRLDKTMQPIPKSDASGASAPSATKVDRTGSLEERVARIEDTLSKNAEALDFLGKVYAQQKQQQQAQQQSEPAPDATFAVDISQNVKAGLVEGPAGAAVTIVEAWDFA
jgi:hypothetical protein